MSRREPGRSGVRSVLALVAAFASALLAACSGSESNEAPTASFSAVSGTMLGGPHLLWADEPAVLDGSASSDPNGDPLSYRWKVVARPVGSTQGHHVVMLTVSDGELTGTLARELVVGPNYGSPLWTLQAPAGSTAVLVGATSDTPGFVADVAGSYLLTWTAGYEEPSPGMPYVDTSDSLEIHAVPPRLAGAAYDAPGGMQVALLTARRSDLATGFVRIEVDLRLRNPGSAALDEAPLHLYTNDGTEALPVDFVAQRIAPGDTAVRTHVYVVPASLTPMMWEYGPASARPAPSSARLTWCAAP